MGADTKIEWARHTFNPWIGCTKVAAACDHCYAEARMDHRLKAVQWGPHGERKRTTAQYWKQPIAWNKAALAAGERPFVFCASLADVFDNQVDAQWRADLFDLIRATPQLVWLLLTKRPGNIVKMVEAAGGLPDNVALGTSCGDQADADRNVPLLLAACRRFPPAFSFVSAEPLLGPIDFTIVGRDRTSALKPWTAPNFVARFPGLDWVIVGGESGPDARPMHPGWARSIRDQCAEAGTAFFFKQWGEWSPHTAALEDGDGSIRTSPRGGVNWQAEKPGGAFGVFRVGKARAGRLLDGVTHDAMPAVRS